MTRPSVQVLTPWIETGCPYRAASREWTERHWASLGVEVVYGSSETVNRSAARNDAAMKATAEVLFFADADTWVPGEQFFEAVERAGSGHLIHAYVKHVRMSKQASVNCVEGKPHRLTGQTVLGCTSGCIAVHRETFDIVGGHDERFTVWGGEDRSFQFACDTLAGPGDRVPGSSYHLWHPSDPAIRQHTPERKAVAALAQRYKRAAGVQARAGYVGPTKNAHRSPEAMLAILREPGGPLHQDVASAHA